MEEFTWKDSVRPHPRLWQRYFSRPGVVIEKDATLLLLDQDLYYHWVLKDRWCRHFIEERAGKFYWNFPQGEGRFKKQLISFNGDYEKELLEASNLETFPHEVAQIRIKKKNGEVICSPLFHGKVFHCQPGNFFQKKILKMLKELEEEGPSLMIEEIEINHTHPSLELIVETPLSKKVYLSGLGRSDVECLKKLSSFFSCVSPLTLRAITPSGINYSLKAA